MRRPLLIILILGNLTLASGCRIGNQIKEAEKEARTQALCSVLAICVTDYHAAFGSLPAGSAEEIANQLRGTNSKGMVFFVPTKQGGNPDGAFRDDWGGEVKYDFRVPTSPVVSSAGPDGRFGTGDDLRN